MKPNRKPRAASAIEPVQRVTKTDLLLAHIEGLGTDKSMKPIGIRTKPLSEATGVPANSIQVLLDPHVKSGRLCVCKVTIPGAMTQNEYRKGAGAPAPGWKPLDTKRRGVAVASAHLKAAPTNKPAVSTPAPSKSPQPEVGKQTPAAGDPGLPRGEPAVAAQATPEPKAPARMNATPSAPEASASDVFSANIDDTGVLIIATGAGVIKLHPKHTKRLGHFMVGSERIWNPF